MPNIVRTARTLTKVLERQSAGECPPNGGNLPQLMRKFRAAYPRKTALHLALATGADVKHCEKCLAGTRQLGADYLIALLRSEFGEQAWSVLMAGSDARWFADFSRQIEISKLRSAQAQMDRQLSALETAQ